jgi:hypothetical protein
MFPYDGADVSPVPPYTTPIEEVADTTPAFACSGPLRPENRASVPTLATVDEEVTNVPYVVEENANDCSAVHELALPRFREIVELVPPSWNPRVPDDVSDDPTARVDVDVVLSVPFDPEV